MRRFLTLRIEVHTQLDHVVGDLLTDRVVVDVPADLRVRQHQFAGVIREDLAHFADRPLHERAGADVVIVVRVRGARCQSDDAILLLDETGDGVMDHAAAAGERGLRLDRLDPALLGQPGVDG